MKTQHAFKLSALTVALTLVSGANASTLDVSKLDVIWDNPRDQAPTNADRERDADGKLLYQYVDVGSDSSLTKDLPVISDNNLTSWYTVKNNDGSTSEIIKIEKSSTESGKKNYNYFDATGLITQDDWKNKTFQILSTLKQVDGNVDVTLADGTVQTITEAQYYTILTVPEGEILAALKGVGLDYDLADVLNIKSEYKGTLESSLIPTNLGGVTGKKVDKELDVNTIKRLDSTYLEYAERAKLTETNTENFGNLTDKDITDPKVWLTINTPENLKTETVYDRGVINGIINTNKQGHLDDANKYVKHFKNLFDENAKLTDNVYGLVASELKTVSQLDPVTGTKISDPITEIDRYTSLTQAGVVVADEIANTQTIITSKDITTGKITLVGETSALSRATPVTTEITSSGITTGSVTVDSLNVAGVDVGQTLSNVAQLGTLTSEQLDAVVKSGESISALDTRVTDVETSVSGLNDRVGIVEKSVTELDTKLTNEVSRLDGRIDAELTKNAEASTDYTNTTAIKLREEAATESARVDEAISSGDKATLDLAKAEDVKTLDAAKAEDVKTLALANKHTDDSVRDITSNAVSVANEYTNQRVNQLNSRINDVEKTAYRGVAIALAAQQQIPNIGAGQFAVFGGVGHYEGETAGAIGIANVFADGRTSLSAALGVAGGNEIGGRVGVSYVFGGK